MKVPVRLQLDLSPAGVRSPRVGWILFALGAMSLLLAAIQFHTAQAARSYEADRLHELQSRVTQASRRGGAVSADSRAAEVASAVIRDLRVPWPALLGAFERAATREVALLSVEPTPAQREVRFTAEARSVRAMLDYLESLGDPLTHVALTSHQLQKKGPGEPIQFQAQAKWKTD